MLRVLWSDKLCKYLYDKSQNLIQGGVLQISSDKDDRRSFLGLKSSIPGFFVVGRIGKYSFGWLDLSRDFFGYSE